MSTVLQVDRRLSNLIDSIPELRAKSIQKRAEADRVKPKNFNIIKADADEIRRLGGDPRKFPTLGWNSEVVRNYLWHCGQADQAAREIPDLARLTQCKAVCDKLICAGFGLETMFFNRDLTILLSELSRYLPDAESEIENPIGTLAQLTIRFQNTGKRLLAVREKYVEGLCTFEAVDALENMIRPLGLALKNHSCISGLTEPLYRLLKEIQDSEDGKFGVAGTDQALRTIFVNPARVSASAPGAGGPAT